MRNPLDLLWGLFDHPEPNLRNLGWQSAAEERLIAANLLISAEPSTWVVCPGCFDHEEEVLVTTMANGSAKAFVPCPEYGRVEVNDRDRRHWQVSPAWIALTLSAGLGFERRCTELLPGRLWRLGRATIRDRSRELLLARGLTWADAGALRSRICKAVDPAVFAAKFPPPEFWLGRPRSVVSLPDLAELGDDGLLLDPLAISSAIDAADNCVSENNETLNSQRQMRDLVRRQIKAERHTELTDAVFVEAYRQTGSYRKAAELLSERTSQLVSKDQVSRAVHRSGGTRAVYRETDSDSTVIGSNGTRGLRNRQVLAARD